MFRSLSIIISVLQGNAAVCMRTLLKCNKMYFDDLASALVKRFASGATN